MAERLTDKHTVSVYNNSNSEIYLGENEEATKYIYKLAELEDIMEKYHCNDIEELSKKIDGFTNFMKGNKFETIEDLQNALNGKFIEVFDEKNKIWQDMVKNLTKTEKDRDTWKRACELACEKLADIYSHCEYELFGDSVDEYRKYCEENGNPLQNIRYCETKYFYQQAKKEKENE